LETEVTITAEKIVEAVKAIMDGLPLKPAYLPESGVRAEAAAVIAQPAAALQGASPGGDLPTGGAAQKGGGLIEVIIPNLGLTITEVAVAKWYKQVGDAVRKGEPLLDFESEKSLVELESPADGRLSSVLAEVGRTVPIGAVVGLIEKTTQP
jgi:biotin carboxyl carrier protein